MAVYFIQNPITNLIKIGKSYTVCERLKALSKKCNVPLKLLGVVSGGYTIESDLHMQFSTDRVTGEWFNPTTELLEFVEKYAVSLNDLVEVKPKPKPKQFTSGKNNIPKLLERRRWTRYRLWKELDIERTGMAQGIGVSGARDTVYRLGSPEVANEPIPPKTQWGTLREIADVLGVGMDDLEYKIVSTSTPAPNDRSWKRSMINEKQVFIWREFMPDYSDGLAFAIAETESEARKLIIEELGYNPSDWGPIIVKTLDEKVAFACCGGE